MYGLRPAASGTGQERLEPPRPGICLAPDAPGLPHNTMTGEIRIGRAFGVQIALHVSWFVIAMLVMMSLGQRFSEAHAGWGPVEVWVTAAVTALLFFVTLVLHELSHALVARSRGLSVR